MLGAERLRRPSLHVDGCQEGGSYNPKSPPDTSKAVTIDYSPYLNQPVRQSTASHRPNQQEGNPNQGGAKYGSRVRPGIASGDAGDNIAYDYTGDFYRRTLTEAVMSESWLNYISQAGKLARVAAKGWRFCVAALLPNYEGGPLAPHRSLGSSSAFDRGLF